MFEHIDSLFIKQNSKYSTVYGANWQDLNWFSNSYLFAFEILLEHCNKEIKHAQILFLPLTFIFRHYIEIKLKEISETMGLIDKTKKPRHDINELWINLSNTINESDKDFSIFSKLISELSKLDSNSMNFRYPTDTKFKKALTFTEIDFENFSIVSNKMSKFLESLSDYCEN